MTTESQALALLIDEKEAVKRYSVSRSWFQRKRWEGGGPPYVKLNSRVLYPVGSTDEWFTSRLVNNSAQSQGGKS